MNCAGLREETSLLFLPWGLALCTGPGRPRGGGCRDQESCTTGGGGLTRDIAGQGQALTVLVLEGGGDRVQPQEEQGLWVQGGEGQG